jgi:hypothetical protein
VLVDAQQRRRDGDGGEHTEEQDGHCDHRREGAAKRGPDPTTERKPPEHAPQAEGGGFGGVGEDGDDHVVGRNLDAHVEAGPHCS